MKTNKYKLTVIYGTDACEIAAEQGVEKAKEALDSRLLDSLQGMHRTYELETEADLEVVKQVLDDFCGWYAYCYE